MDAIQSITGLSTLPLLLLGLALVAGGCGISNDDAEPERTTGEVRGSVSLADGDPSGALVLLESASARTPSLPEGRLLAPDGRTEIEIPAPKPAPLSGPVDTTTTDTNGGFVFADVAPGAYTLYAQSASSLRAVHFNVQVTAGQVTNVGQIVLTPTGSISGTVALEGESNHSGAIVFVAYPSGQPML